MNASDLDHLDGSDGLGLGPDLTARLRAAAGAEPDLAAARAVLGRRVAGARRRRVVTMTGSAGLSVLLLGAMYVANTGDRGGRISSADAPAVAPVGDGGSSTSVTATTVAPIVETVVTTVPGASTGSVAAPAGPGPAATFETSSSLDDTDDGSDETDLELFDVTAGATEVRTVSGIGGAVDVRLENGVLAFASFPVAADGFTSVVTRDEPDRLEVSFISASHRTRLRVRLDAGRWRADRHEEAIPTSSVPGSPTGTAPHTANDDDSNDDDSNDDSSNDDSSNDSSDDDSNGDDSNDDSSNGSNGGRGSGSSGSGSDG